MIGVMMITRRRKGSRSGYDEEEEEKGKGKEE